jgi:hypothetical protein
VSALRHRLHDQDCSTALLSLARGSAAGYLITHDPGFSPVDEMAETPAVRARGVLKKRQEGLFHRRECLRRFPFRPCDTHSPASPRQARLPLHLLRRFSSRCFSCHGDSNPIAPTAYQRFSSLSDLFTLRRQNSCAPACSCAAKLKRSFSVTNQENIFILLILS